MSRTIVECVPNFSEGRDAAKVRAIVEAIGSVEGVAVLGFELDQDHNRSVVTFAGPAERIGEAALRGVERAVALIDLREHRGVHPRIGAADVVPFVPVEGVSLEDCAAIARETGRQIWERLGVPVYLYEAAACLPERVRLENIRRGQFEGLREEVRENAERRPDFGEPELHPTAGSTVVGARKFLLAYNINLQTPDVGIARRIARTIRMSSGGLPCVKAMGVLLASRNLAQVSMNLTDFEQTSLYRVFEAVRAEAARDGVEIAGSEIIGFVPRRALEQTAAEYLRVENFHPRVILENRLAEARMGGGLDEFLDELAAPTSTPGGGSAAAAAGAMAAALGVMIAHLAKLPAERFEASRRFFAQAVKRDAAAYAAVVAAHKQHKGGHSVVERALYEAARVPLQVAEHAAALKEELRRLALASPAKFASDIETAAELAKAAFNGAMANVRVNLDSMTDVSLIAELRELVSKLPA